MSKHANHDTECAAAVCHSPGNFDIKGQTGGNMKEGMFFLSYMIVTTASFNDASLCMVQSCSQTGCSVGT